MPYKIGIITSNTSFFDKLNLARKSDAKFELVMIKSSSSLAQVAKSNGTISGFLFDDSLNVFDILSMAELIRKINKFDSSLFFLAFDDFQTFAKITTSKQFSKAKVINMPASAQEIYSKVTSDINQINNESNKQTNQKTNQNDAKFLNIFIDSAVATVQEMSGCSKISYTTPALLDYSKLEESISIRGKITISSPYFNGSFFISFPEKTFLNLATKVLMEETTQISKDNEDLVSELCNIVYGKCKVLLAKLDMPLGMVIPTHNRDPKITSSGRILIVKFTTDMGTFYIKVAPGLT